MTKEKREKERNILREKLPLVKRKVEERMK
jgi:hypothetical protein